MNGVRLSAVPPIVVMRIVPEVVFGATIALIVVSLTTVNDTGILPSNNTEVTPIKFVPVMVTCIFGPAADGVNDVIVGAGIGWFGIPLSVACTQEPIAIFDVWLPVLSLA